MTKVKLPRLVADKLDQLRSFGYSTETIFACRADTSPNYAILRTIPFDTFLQAVVSGYEREVTEVERQAEAIERIKTTYQRKRTEARDARDLYEAGIYWRFIDGMKFVLNELGVVIDGVNNIKTEVSANG